MAAIAKKHVYLSDLHFEHSLWLNELDFSKDELYIFTNRLAGAVEKNTDKDFTPTAESFQNKLIRQKEVVDELHHAIKKHESELAHYAQEHPIAIDHVHFTDHVDLRQKMARFTSLYASFKKEFLHFIAEWM
jgi:ATP/maltotriose-dependent transcriptional regulator MalT